MSLIYEPSASHPWRMRREMRRIPHPDHFIIVMIRWTGLAAPPPLGTLPTTPSSPAQFHRLMDRKRGSYAHGIAYHSRRENGAIDMLF